MSYKRPTATYPTLNSIIDNPNYGDERSFFDVRHAEDEGYGGFCNSLHVADGDVLLFRAYVENSSGDLLADPEYAGELTPGPGQPFDGSGVARDTRIRIVPDDRIASLRTVWAFVESSTTLPPEIYDAAEVSADYPFRLDYVAGSGMMQSNVDPNGRELDTGIWDGEGALLGFEELDGDIQPGYRYSLLVTVKARVTRVAE